MDFQTVKETAWKWTQRVALFWLLQSSLAYFSGCVVAGRPIGPVEYVRFQYHVIQWRPQPGATAPVAASVRGR